MIALDTTVLVRFFVDDPDDPEAARQRPAAVAALEERVFVPVTVLLELEWVLRGFYKSPRAEILRAFRALAGFNHVSLEDRTQFLAALDAYATGLDFADALHVARSSRAASFRTFDRRLAKSAARAGLATPVQALG
jgi:predicted nucleic-acid-binding protein